MRVESNLFSNNGNSIIEEENEDMENGTNHGRSSSYASFGRKGATSTSFLKNDNTRPSTTMGMASSVQLKQPIK